MTNPDDKNPDGRDPSSTKSIGKKLKKVGLWLAAAGTFGPILMGFLGVSLENGRFLVVLLTGGFLLYGIGAIIDARSKTERAEGGEENHDKKS